MCGISSEGITDTTYDDGVLGSHNYTRNVIPDCLKSAATCENKAVYYQSCSVCGEKSSEYTFEHGEFLDHDYSDWKSNGDGTHSKTCSHDTNLDHVITKNCFGGEATCTKQAVCNDCKGEYGELAKHSYAENDKEEYLKTPATCTSRAVYYKSCSVCTAKGNDTFESGPFVHKYGSDDLCTECNAHKPTEGIIYRVENNEFAYVDDVSEDMKESFVYLAKDYMGYPVTAIYGRFINDSVKSVYIHNGITKIIGDIIFDKGSLENLYIDSLESWCNIEFSAPSGGFTPNPLCYFDNLFVNGVKVGDELIIPNTVKEIKQSAFFASKFKKITIPSSVEVIGKGAFECCNNITEINIPNGVKTIKEQAFGYCTNLLSVTIPQSLEEIEPDAFIKSEMLVEIINHSNLSLNVGEKGSIAEYALTVHKGSKSIIEKVGDFIFITVNDSRYLLGYEGNLIRITLPPYGKNYVIYKNAMKNKKIVSVVIPDYVTDLPEYAFFGCDELVEVVDNGNRGFHFNYGNDGLSFENKGESKIKKVDDYLFLTINESTEYEQNYLIKYVGTAASIVLPESYNGKKYVIYKYAFSLASALTEVTFSNGVKYIGQNAFANTGITTVTLSDSVESIDNNAFIGCKNLTSIYIPNSVEIIGSHVFSDCTSLTEVTLGKGVKYIGYDAFSGCPLLKSINYNGTIEEFNEIDWRDKSDYNYTVNCSDGTIS